MIKAKRCKKIRSGDRVKMLLENSLVQVANREEQLREIEDELTNFH